MKIALDYLKSCMRSSILHDNQADMKTTYPKDDLFVKDWLKNRVGAELFSSFHLIC
jgi:hypothetical protein